MFTIILTIFAIIVLLAALGFKHSEIVAQRKQIFELRTINESWEYEFNKLSGISHQYKNACRLVGIYRSGRLNNFHFIRDDKKMVIPTMGLMSDLPNEWRAFAGLENTIILGNTAELTNGI